MSIYQVCTVLDMVAKQYGRPFFTVSKGSAVRGFADQVNTDVDSILYRHPSDFQLFLIGEFDDESCSFNLLSTPELLISGSQVAVMRDSKPTE